MTASGIGHFRSSTDPNRTGVPGLSSIPKSSNAMTGGAQSDGPPGIRHVTGRSGSVQDQAPGRPGRRRRLPSDTARGTLSADTAPARRAVTDPIVAPASRAGSLCARLPPRPDCGRLLLHRVESCDIRKTERPCWSSAKRAFCVSDVRVRWTV